MNSFWVNIYKPYGVPSTRVTNLIKKIFKPSKVGHAGTLDPLAEGLLPIAVGEATKTIEYIHDARKTYQFEVQFGRKSSTGDLEGDVVSETDKLPLLQGIKSCLPNFTGDIKQVPPKYSALKIDGKRAYDLAREGVDFEIKEREVTIHNLELLDYKLSASSEGGKDAVSSALFEVECSLGTYVRTLAEDISEYCDSLGVVSLLKRTKYGCFDISKSIGLNINENKKIIDDLQDLEKSIIRQSLFVDVVLDDIPVLHLDSVEVTRLRQGQRLRYDAEEKSYRIYDQDNNFSLIARQQGGVLRPYKVFNL